MEKCAQREAELQALRTAWAMPEAELHVPGLSPSVGRPLKQRKAACPFELQLQLWPFSCCDFEGESQGESHSEVDKRVTT